MKYDIRRSIADRETLPDNPTRTICDVHRDAYRLARSQGDDQMMALLAEAFDMGKRMDAKLRAGKARR